MKTLDRLYEQVHKSPERDFLFSPNPRYEQYLRMHKVFVGDGGADELIVIHNSLKQEYLPRYLSAAGWAGIEASLVKNDMTTASKGQLFDASVACWHNALSTQLQIDRDRKDYLIEDSAKYRLALDIAVAPLLKGIVLGNVTDEAVNTAYADILGIAQAAMLQLKLAASCGDFEAVSDLSGFGYECNALLLFNFKKSKTWFAIPSTVRGDSGHHYKNQTHDLSIINQQWGGIKSVTPVEIKASASTSDRRRYDALLVRGKMHLSLTGRYKPHETLDMIAKVYDGTASKVELDFIRSVSARITDMTRYYYEGDNLDFSNADRSPTRFRDSTKVVENYPGLKVA